MPFPARHLRPGEEVVVDVGPHWWDLSGPVALVVVVLAGAVDALVEGAARPVDLAVVVVLGAALVRLVARYLRWRSTRLVVTTDRLIRRRGVLARRRREFALDHLAGVTYRQNALQRVLGAGDLVLRPAGGGREVLAWWPHPAALHRDIERQMLTLVERRRGERSVAEELARLDALRLRGVLTPSEFQAEKARLLWR